MKYTCTIDIDLAIDKVVELWTDENHFNKWQDGFKSIELLDEEQDKVGAKSKIYFQQGKRKMELVETIITNNLPKEEKSIVRS